MKMQPRLRSLLFVHLLISAAAAGQGEFPVKEENGVRSEMRDGVSLVADIFRPDHPDLGGPIRTSSPAWTESAGRSS